MVIYEVDENSQMLDEKGVPLYFASRGRRVAHILKSKGIPVTPENIKRQREEIKKMLNPSNENEQQKESLTPSPKEIHSTESTYKESE